MKTTESLSRLALLSGALLGFTGVILSAVGSHALQHLPHDAQEAVRLAAQFQLIHGLFLVALAALVRQGWSLQWLRLSVLSTLTGVLLFCGSIYLHRIGEVALFKPVPPIGGLLVFAGWFFLVICSAKRT